MAVPKKKVSPGRKKQRRQFYALKPEGHVVCPNCLDTRRPHRVCVCGFYDGRQVTQPKTQSTETA
ncbi:MAG TPA: 50S ribosomal protein L32 [Oligoflexia bacterium]|nr:50S ribosomal protein L32 [Oligoflexia bacterium]